MSAKEADIARHTMWLDAWTDPVATAPAFSSCMDLVDVDGSGDNYLVVGVTHSQRLRVYRGGTLHNELRLLDSPCAVQSFYPADSTPGAPALPLLGVAAGPYVFIYRGLRAYFKWVAPAVRIDERETEVWQQLRAGDIDSAAAYTKLSEARDSGCQLSSRAQDVLALETPEQVAELVGQVKQRPVVQQTCITCLGVLNRSISDPGSASSLVVGTESRFIYILRPALKGNDSNILAQVQLPSAPTFLAAAGTFNVLYRITVACRDNTVYTIKNGELTGNCIRLGSPCTALTRLGKNVWVATADGGLHSYHIKGKKNFTLQLPATAVALAPMQLMATHSATPLAVGMTNGEIRIYNEKALVEVSHVGASVTGLAFGACGREPNTLAFCTRAGTLGLKILRRKAQFQSSGRSTGGPPEQDVPLPVPRKTKAYIEQTQRERETASVMHRAFQRDLCKVRLETARAYVRVIEGGRGPQAYGARASIRFNARVRGIGPRFKVDLDLRNTGTSAVHSVTVAVSFDPEQYAVSRPLMSIPSLLPGLSRIIQVDVTSVSPVGAAGELRVAVIGAGDSSVPLLSAVVTMPASEVEQEE